eukprot:9059044-Prorocentrum_lima.AAC.1
MRLPVTRWSLACLPMLTGWTMGPHQVAIVPIGWQMFVVQSPAGQDRYRSAVHSSGIGTPR